VQPRKRREHLRLPLRSLFWLALVSRICTLYLYHSALHILHSICSVPPSLKAQQTFAYTWSKFSAPAVRHLLSYPSQRDTRKCLRQLHRWNLSYWSYTLPYSPITQGNRYGSRGG